MLFDENGEIIPNPNDIANLLQKQFLSVFSDPTKTTIDKATFPSPLIKHPLTDDILEFTNTDIIEAIDDVKPNAASGPDEIPVILLKNCKEALAEPIHLICSASLASGTVPSFYKTSYVFPLHKKESKPISLTSHIIKIYERVIRKKLLEYLEQNDLICNKQHGFRSGRSCLTQLLHHFDDVLESLTNNAEFDSIYLDYAKAFDKVDHKLLMKKLHLYGHLSELPFMCKHFQYNVADDITLRPVHQLRDLGILMSSDLSWSPHIRAIANKAHQKASWVLSVFHTRTASVMLTLYKSMVRSLLEYCCPLWHPIKISDIQELESVQKAFTARISGIKDMRYWDRLVHQSLMSLQRRRERYIILHMWKILHGCTSNDLNVQFVTRPRFGNIAVIPSKSRVSTAANQSLYDSSFAVQEPKLWNAIPYHLNVVDKAEHFKDQLTKFMLSIPDTPPIRGYASKNSNSLLCWRKERGYESLWGWSENLMALSSFDETQHR